MRIAYVSQSYPPMISGAALVTQQLAEGMVRRGHTVEVIAASDRPYPYTNGGNGLRLVRLRSIPTPTRVGQRFAVFPRTEIAAQLEAFAPDVVHSHCCLNVGVLGLRAACEAGVPTVLTIHQLPWFVSAYLPDLPGLRWGVETCLWFYARYLLQNCRASVTPTHTIAEAVRAFCDHRPQVISNGIDLQHFTPRQSCTGEGDALRLKYGLDPELPVMIHVGRIDSDKRVDLVVRAAARAMRSVDSQILVVGDGTRREALLRLSAKLGISHRSHFPGFVPQSGDLPGLYRLASAFVTCSEIETQGMVILEAAASGLPVVAARAGAVPEAVKDGVTGYLVSPRDVSAMASHLTLLLREPDRAKGMGQAGRALAENHSHDVCVLEHECLYRSIGTD